MTDKEMLMMAYGKLKDRSSGDDAVVKMIEEHLWPTPKDVLMTEDEWEEMKLKKDNTELTIFGGVVK